LKVIKRDGRVVDYNKDKILIAIEKANNEVIDEKEKASKEDIKIITNYIEKIDKKRILVEDMQDIIEQKLMEIGKYELAKKYIVYRYTRALVRKSNTTDETILGLIRNQNRIEETKPRDMLKVSSQRDYIAGEVSRDLTKRLLLPEKISKANEEGILYFHNSDYFMGTSINYCVTDVKDMLYNGTIINEVKIEEPRTFDKACNILTQIIAQVGSNLYGKQYIDLSCLGRFLKKSVEEYEKEFKFKERFNENELEEIISNYEQKQLKEGVQTIKYQLKTLNTTGGKEPQVILYLDLNQEKEYLKENLKIKEELIKQMPEEISEEKYKFQGKFNQGIVSINLPQIAIIADENEEKFYQILDERLELCKEALMCRHYQLLGTLSDASPIIWQNGGISRLKSGEKIDKLLHGKYSNLSLGYIGTNEMAELIKPAESIEEKNKFIINVIKNLKETIEKWKKETDIIFVLDGHPPENVGHKFATKDKERYGTIKNVTDKGYYTN
jgi:anaerobic ribonucleoside-triphosphate reductase